MVIHRETGKIEHKLFRDLIDYFDEGDVMVLNRQAVHGSFANASPDRRITLNAGFFPAEFDIKIHARFGTTLTEHMPEPLGGFRIEDIAGFLECLKGICIKRPISITQYTCCERSTWY